VQKKLKQAGDIEKGKVHFDVMVIANEQSPEVAKPGEGAFDFPAVTVRMLCESLTVR
jgi:hypothetical protein